MCTQHYAAVQEGQDAGGQAVQKQRSPLSREKQGRGQGGAGTGAAPPRRGAVSLTAIPDARRGMARGSDLAGAPGRMGKVG